MSPDPLAWSVPWLGLALHTDTLLALAGVGVGVVALRVAARARRLEAPTFSDLANVVLWAVVVARVWYVAEQWQFFLRYPLAIFNIVDGGLAAPGLLVGAMWGLRGLVRSSVFTWSLFLPVLGRALAAARSVQLTGCVLTGCISGSPTNLPWAVQQDIPRQPLALYGVLLLALAWFAASRVSVGRRWAWLPVGVYLAAEVANAAIDHFLSAPSA